MTTPDQNQRPRGIDIDPRQHQEHVMRWIIFATIILLAFAPIAAFIARGASMWAATLVSIPATALLWLMRILFAPQTLNDGNATANPDDQSGGRPPATPPTNNDEALAAASDAAAASLPYTTQLAVAPEPTSPVGSQATAA